MQANGGKEMRSWWQRFKDFWAPSDFCDDYLKSLERQKEQAEHYRKSLQKAAEQSAKEARAELRDRFAMSVVSGVYLHWRTSLDKVELGCNIEDIAEMAYGVADAMLKARGMENEQ